MSFLCANNTKPYKDGKIFIQIQDIKTLKKETYGDLFWILNNKILKYKPRSMHLQQK